MGTDIKMCPPADEVKFLYCLVIKFDSQTTYRNPSNHLKLHQFGHELLDSLGVVGQHGAESFPTHHDSVHLDAIPTEH